MIIEIDDFIIHYPYDNLTEHQQRYMAFIYMQLRTSRSINLMEMYTGGGKTLLYCATFLAYIKQFHLKN